MRRLRLLVRARGPAPGLACRVQAPALSVNPDLRLTQVMSSDQAAEAYALYMGVFPRMFAVIAVAAMLLPTSGLYALTSLTLARRTREIAIRVALGAAPP
jgi:macrolide transport system ATP-binding/permease protein